MIRIHDRDRIEHLIARSELVDVLPADLRSCLYSYELERGDYLCRQGESISEVYVLVEGKLQVDYVHLDGYVSVLSFERPVSTIGDLELFHGGPAITNVSAIETSRVLAIALRDANHYEDDPQLLRFINGQLTSKLRFAVQLLFRPAMSTEQRVAHYLLLRTSTRNNVIKLEHRDALASIWGTSNRHLNRVFRRLEELGAINVRNKTLTIISVEKLIEIRDKET